MYINSTNIPPIMIINRIYEHQKSSVAVACFLPGRAKDLSAPLYVLLYSVQREGQPYNHTLLTDYETRFLGDGTDYSEINSTEAFGSPGRAKDLSAPLYVLLYSVQSEGQPYNHTLLTDYETRFLGDGTDY